MADQRTRVWIDIETYHETLDVTKVGAWRYAEGVEIMLIALAQDQDPVSVWDLTDTSDLNAERLNITKILRHLVDDDCIFVAHNCQFERACIREYLGIDIPIEQWEDTAVFALMHGYPHPLGMLGEALHIPADQAKDREGKRLIQKFCKPRNPSKNNPATRWTRENAPEDWQKFVDYCRRDVEVMRQIADLLPRFNWTETERNLWYLDQRINERGLPIDTEAMDAWIDAIETETARLNAELNELTGGAVSAATKRDALLEWLADHGPRMPGLTKYDVSAALDSDEYDEAAKRALQIRQQVSKTSNAKFKKLRDCVCRDGRMRGTLQFCGAFRTARWSGRLIQPQNLPSRELIPDPDIAIDVLVNHGPEAVKMLYAEPLVDIASASIRGMIAAPADQQIVAADLAGIEARMLQWLAMDDKGLQVFRDGRDVYKFRASQIFNVAETSIDKSSIERLVGKVAELALGYQGSVNAFRSMMKTLKIPQDMFTDTEIRAFVRGYREMNDQTKTLWYDTEKAAVSAMRCPGETFTCRRVSYIYKPNLANGMLLARLPSGRCIVYVEPELRWRKIHYTPPEIADAIADCKDEVDLYAYCQKLDPPITVRARPDDDLETLKKRATAAAAREVEKEVITYMGMHKERFAWTRLAAYGGKFVENTSQSASRDVIAHAMPAVEDAGYAIITTVHDEIVSVTPAMDGYTGEGMSALLSANPPWCPDLPLAAAGFEAQRYRKD